jgi:gliding motility-associated-like protein
MEVYSFRRNEKPVHTNVLFLHDPGMRKKYLLFLVLICTICKQQLFSQKIYNTWFFGYHSGLDFNTSPPTPLTNPLIEGDEPPYYTSSICDASGSLLFFTDGIKVWNASNSEMPKLSGRWPWEWDQQVLPLICPYPENDSLYYLFTVGKGAKDAATNGGPGVNARKFLFTTINMTANGNTGEIVYPQPASPTNYFTVLADNASFMLAGTGHCNQRDTWIVSIANGALNSFLISPGQVSTTPITTSLPIPQSDLDDGYSNIKFSPNGEKLVIPVVSKNEMLVYDFNNLTGVFSNPVLLHLPSKELLEDVELSPTGSKLYYGSYWNEMDGNEFTGIEIHNIYQLDLESGSATGIENSRYQVNPFPNRSGCTPASCYIIKRTLQLGPDGKIYVSLRNNFDNGINLIEFPDRDKEYAIYPGNYLRYGKVYRFINVNYIRSASFSPKENGIQVRKKLCLGLPSEFSLLYTKIDSVKWDFGDPASGANNYSAAITPSHNYTAVNQYTVKAIIYKACHVDTAITKVSIDPDPIVRIPAYIRDTIVCIGNKLTINATAPGATQYMWSDNLRIPYREINQAGDFLIRAYNACSEDLKSFTVKFEECPCEVFIPSAFTPNHDGLNDDFKPIAKCAAKNYQFKVFNRYGNIVFATNELNKGWNGKYKNLDLPTGVYAWMLEYSNPNNKQAIRKQGTVTLIR